jgi:hypothetical protein
MSKNGNGEYYVELGIDSLSNMYLTYYAAFGLFFSQSVPASTSTGFSVFHFTADTRFPALGAHYYAAIPGYSSSSNNMVLTEAAKLRFLRFGYTSTPSATYTIDVSYDRLHWTRIHSASGWAPAFGAPVTLTGWGIQIDNTNNSGLVPAGTTVFSARVCHLLQVDSPPPTPA